MMPWLLRRSRWLLAVAATIGLVLAGTTARADAPPRQLSGWLPHWAVDQALANISANADLFDEASPFWHTAIAANGAVSLGTSVPDETLARAVAELRARSIRVLPSVADGSGAGKMAAILADPAARATHVEQLVALVTGRGYDGIDLDYEKFAFSDGRSTWAATQPNWIAFITELAAALHAQGKLLAVTVPPVYSAGTATSSGYWVYSLAEIAPSVDSLRIMAYDYSVSRPGPIAPLAFVRKSLAWVVTVVPPAKIRVGLPAYGRIWVARRADGSESISGTCPTSGVTPTRSFTAAEASTVLAGVAGAPVTPTWDAATAEVTASFARTYAGSDSAGNPTSCVVDHVAWWVDAQGAVARMAFVTEFGLAGAAFWQLAGVDAQTWAGMRGSTASPAPTAAPTIAAATVEVTAPARVPAGTAITVQARVTAPAGIPAGTLVTLRSRRAGSSKWSLVGTSATDATGVAGFNLPSAAASTTWRAQVPASDGHSAAEGRASTTVARVVSLTVSEQRPRAGRTVTFRAKVKPVAKKVKVTLQRLVHGRWRSVSSARTTTKGIVRLRTKPSKSATTYTYRAVAGKTAALAAGVSPHVKVRTR